MDKFNRVQVTLKQERRAKREKERQSRWQRKDAKHTNYWGTSNPIQRKYDFSDDSNPLNAQFKAAGASLRRLGTQVLTATLMIPPRPKDT